MARTLSRQSTLRDFTAGYGPEWIPGVLADHLYLALEAGLVVHESASGRTMWLTEPEGGEAVPVVCGDIIEIWTEDGMTDGHCGMVVEAGGFACVGHTEARNHWMSLTEGEKVAIERREAKENGW